MQAYLGKYPGSRSNSTYKFLRAVQSFIDQSNKNNELIIVSDACEIVHELYHKHYKNESRIKYVYLDKDVPNMYEGSNKYYRGFPRQVARSLVTGEITTYIDSDDYLMPNSTDVLIRAWEIYKPMGVKFISNASWFDNIKALDYELEFSQITDKIERVNIDSLDGIWYAVNLPVGPNNSYTVCIAPWLQSHISDMDIKWMDTGGDTGINLSEDALFHKQSISKYKLAVIDIPIYVRCHRIDRWDY